MKAALRYITKRRKSWDVRAVAISGQTGQGIDALCAIVEEHHQKLVSSGELATLRASQQKDWLWSLVHERLEQAFRENPAVAARLAGIEAEVLGGTTTAPAATDELFGLFGGSGGRANAARAGRGRARSRRTAPPDTAPRP